MQLTLTQSRAFARQALELIPRLEDANQLVKESRSSSQFIDGVLKMSIAFAIFLLEVSQEISKLSAEQITVSLQAVEEHCSLIETQLPIAA